MTPETRELLRELARSRYDADVRLGGVEPGPIWWGAVQERSVGFVAWIGRDPLSRRAFPSADAAWDAILERLVIVRPGVLKLTSVEFGDRARAAVAGDLCQAAAVVERQRLEIRAMGDEAATLSPSVAPPHHVIRNYQVFRLTRRYRDDAPSRDISQTRVGGPFEPYCFPSLGAAAEYVVGAVANALADRPADAITAQGLPAESRGRRMRPEDELSTSISSTPSAHSRPASQLTAQRDPVIFRAR